MGKGKQHRKKPGRPRAHELGDLGYTKFLATRPPAWVVHKIDGSNDYGRDGLVEIFESGEATGDEFSAQFKGTDKTGPAKTKLNVATLNLWEEQPSPTLILVWKSETDSLFYQWAHLLPFHRTKPDQIERTVHVPHEWTAQTPADLVAEVRAYRAARSLARYLPIQVSVTGGTFFGEDAGEFVAAVIDAIDPLRDFEVSFGAPRIPYLRIELKDDGVDVSLSGSAVKSLTYGGEHQPPPEVVAADALFALSFAVGVTGGSPEVGATLMEAAASNSFMAMVSGRLGDAVAILARRGSDEAVMALLRRSLFVENHPNASEAWAGLFAARADATDALRIKIADAMERAAVRWKRPADGLTRAALILAHLDRSRSLALWEKAAKEDPALLRERIYWKERGGLLFMGGQFAAATKSYRAGVRLGDESARPLLADSLMWSGEYSQALQEFERAHIREGSDNAEWRRNWLALDMLVTGSGISRQDRDPFAAERVWATHVKQKTEATPDLIEEVLALDALYGAAHWAKCPLQAAENIIPIDSLVLASISLWGIPAVWQELACAALNVGARQTARDALLLARRFCESDFLKLLHTDGKHVGADTRRILLALWDSLDDFGHFNKVADDEAARQGDIGTGLVDVQAEGAALDGSAAATPPQDVGSDHNVE